MQDIYRMMEERSSREFAPEGEFDKQAWAERKQSERQEAFDRADAAALRANSDPAALETYMRVAAQLPHHSATNILLIADRIPNATRVGTAEHWRRQGASVRRGQKAIPIIEPVKEYVRDDGSIGVLYDVRKVFDVSQTTARPCLPRRVDPHAALAALVARSPTRIEPVDDLGGVPAEYDHASGAIRVQRGLDEPQLLSALIVEAAHASMALGLDAYDRETHAAKADLAAGIAARRLSGGAMRSDTSRAALPISPKASLTSRALASGGAGAATAPEHSSPRRRAAMPAARSAFAACVSLS